MKEFFIRIISQFTGRGTEEARRSTQQVGEAAQRVNREAAQPGRWRRFWGSFSDGARRSGVALAGLIRQMRTFIGIGLAGAVTLIGRSMLQAAEATQRFAQTAGTTNREAQQFTRVAEDMNVSVSALESGIRSMNRRVKDMEDDFRSAGIETRTAEGDFRSTRDIFLDLVEVIGGMASAQERASLAQRLMGQAGQALLPIMTASREEIEKLMDSTRVMSDQTIERLDALQERWNAFNRTVTVASAEAGNEFVTTFDSAFTFIGFQIEKAGRSWADFFRGVRRVAGVEEDLAEQAKELGEAEKRISDEKDRQREAMSEAFSRMEQVNRIQEEYQASLEDSRSAAEQLENVQERIAELTLKVIANEKGSVDAAREKYALKLREKELQEEISLQEEADRQARESEQDNRDSLEAELAIMRARAAGDQERADQLEREKREREITRRIVRETGMSEADALASAREKLSLEAQIASQKERQRAATRQEQATAEELTETERRRRELLEAAARDPFGSGLEGRGAIRELQDMGEISTTQRVAQEQLLGLQARRQRGEDIFDRPSTATQGPPSPQVVPLHREPFPSSERLPTTGGDDRRITQAGERVSGAVQEHQAAVLQVLEELSQQLTANRRQIETLKTQIAAGRN